MSDSLPFVSLTKESEFILKLQGDTLTVLCSLFENPVIVYKYYQGVIALAVSPQIRPHM